VNVTLYMRSASKCKLNSYSETCNTNPLTSDFSQITKKPAQDQPGIQSATLAARLNIESGTTAGSTSMSAELGQRTINRVIFAPTERIISAVEIAGRLHHITKGI
jgi:hypothetical protein